MCTRCTLWEYRASNSTRISCNWVIPVQTCLSSTFRNSSLLGIISSILARNGDYRSWCVYMVMPGVICVSISLNTTRQFKLEFERNYLLTDLHWRSCHDIVVQELWHLVLLLCGKWVKTCSRQQCAWLVALYSPPVPLYWCLPCLFSCRKVPRIYLVRENGIYHTCCFRKFCHCFDIMWCVYGCDVTVNRFYWNDMGVLWEEFGRHGVIDAARMRFALLNSSPLHKMINEHTISLILLILQT